MAIPNTAADVMMALRGREIEAVPLADVVSRQREANLDYYEMVKMLAFCQGRPTCR